MLLFIEFISLPAPMDSGQHKAMLNVTSLVCLLKINIVCITDNRDRVTDVKFDLTFLYLLGDRSISQATECR